MDRPPLVARSFFYVLFAVCPILFFTDLTRNPYYTQIALLNITVAGIWIVWLVQAWRKKELLWVSSDLDIPLLALLGFSLISWGCSFINHPAFARSIYSEGSRGAIFLLMNTFLVYAAALRLQDREFAKRLLWIVYVVCAVAALYGIAQYFGEEWIWPNTLNPYGSRPVSTFGNPNFMSSYLVVVLPVMVADFLFRSTGFPRPLLLGSIVLTVGALLATLTRSSWFGAVVGLMILTYGIARQYRSHAPSTIPFPRKAIKILVLVLGITVLFWPRGRDGVYSATVFDRLSEVRSAATTHYAPVYQRLLIWTCAWTMAQDHPFVGKGWGTVELFYPFYQGPQMLTKTFGTLRTHANNAHNELLEYLSQLGIIGFGLMIWVWVVFFRQASAIAVRAQGAQQPLIWGFLAGVAGMLADNLLNVSVHFAVPAFIFWWWVGSVFATDPEAVREKSIPVKGPWKLAIPLAIVGLCLLSARAFAMWRGEVNFFEGFKLSKGGNLALSARALEQARFWHRYEVNNNYELANVYARMGDRTKAMALYKEALNANAGYDEIYFNRATMAAQNAQVEEAIANYRIAIAINPLSHDAYNALGAFYFKDLNKYAADAESLYRQGVLVFPSDRDLWNNLGYLYTQQKRWPESHHAYRKALEIDPEFDLARRNLFVAATHVPGADKDPLLNLPAYFQQIDRLLDSRRYAEAKAQALALTQSVPTSFRAYFLLGNAEFFLNQLDDAVKSFQKSLEIERRAPTTWKNLGVTLDRLGRTAEAEAAYKKLLEVDPTNRDAKARLRIP